MAWYSARFLMKSTIHKKADGVKGGSLEEKIIIFKSQDQGHASVKIRKLVKDHEQSYQNQYGDVIKVKVERILEVQEILSRHIKDGTEVFFRFLNRPPRRILEFLTETHEKPWW